MSALVIVVFKMTLFATGKEDLDIIISALLTTRAFALFEESINRSVNAAKRSDFCDLQMAVFYYFEVSQSRHLILKHWQRFL